MNFIYKLNERDLKISRAATYFLLLSLIGAFVNLKAFSVDKSNNFIVTYIVSVLLLLTILASKWFLEGLVIKGVLWFSGGKLEYRQILNILVNNQIVLIICTLILLMISMFDNQIILGQSGKIVKIIMQMVYMLSIFKSISHVNHNLNKYKLLIPLMLMVCLNIFL
ncbi:hypothetical protein ACFQZ1_18375 [Bacillus sp. CGMCC 1.60114]|uniref:hypothetical protein n=1 Tax=unclassified Bacillus (in: firmicutes) TaxID=185979 RepID=UPI0036403CFC